MGNVRKYTWVTLIVGLIILVISVGIGIYNEIRISSIIAIGGVIGSWTALAITLIRIYHIEKLSDRIEREVEFTKSQVVRQLTIKDIRRAREKVTQISDSINNREYRLIEERLRNFVQIMVSIRESKIGEKISGVREYNNLKTGLQQDLIALSNKTNNYEGFNFEVLNRRLVEVSDFLSELERAVQKNPPRKNGR
jgi:hypothetical protein